MTDDEQVFKDHRFRRYTVKGGVGGTTVRGTKARVWIMVANQHGQDTMSRWIRLDLHSAREFHTAYGLAIEEAQRQETLYFATLAKCEAQNERTEEES